MAEEIVEDGEAMDLPVLALWLSHSVRAGQPRVRRCAKDKASVLCGEERWRVCGRRTALYRCGVSMCMGTALVIALVCDACGTVAGCWRRTTIFACCCSDDTGRDVGPQ